MGDPLLADLRTHFGWEGFRPGQAEAVRSILAGRHGVVVMPSGAGKSLVYQLATLRLPGTTLVISPLIALMQDQVDALNGRGIPAVFINSTFCGDEQDERLRRLIDGSYRLAYVAPERLRSLAFQKALGRVKVGLLAVDEAHCLLQWGYDFRPDYLHIAAARARMGSPVTLALTATATPGEQDEIVRLLGLPAAERVVTGFDRPNLVFEVLQTPTIVAKLEVLRGLLARLEGGTALVYVATRRDAEDVAEFVREICGLEARHYHAGLEPGPRAEIQDAFMSGRIRVVSATNAFGMGIDPPGVRLVVHFHAPHSLESYYQEAGRAGRDGQPARAVLLYAAGDRALQERIVANSLVTLEDLHHLHQALHGWGRTPFWKTAEELALATGLSEVKVRVGLSRLEVAGALEYFGYAGHSMLLGLGTWDEAAVREAVKIGADQQAHRQERLAAMTAYAEARTCRRRILLDWLGEAAPATSRPCCDNCEARPPATGRRRLARSTWKSLRDWSRRLAPWFTRPVSREVAQFLWRTQPQLLKGPWYTGWTLGSYHRFSGVSTRTLLGGLVYRFKYCREPAALRHLLPEVLRVCAADPVLLDVDALVPVPPSRLHAPDSVWAFAEALGAQTGRPVWPILSKTRRTLPQKALRTPDEKNRNVAGAFAEPTGVHGRRFLLLDDIYDSGATLEEATRTLHRAGAARVCVLTLIRTSYRKE